MKILKGNPVSRGIALGNVFIYRAFKADVHEAYFEAGHEQEQLEKYRSAVRMAEAELDAVIAKFSSVSEEKAKIFAAHKEILTDEEVIDGIEEMILTDHTLPNYAVDTVFTEFAVMLSKAKDPLIAARAADLRDVRNRVLRILHGEKEMNLANLTKEVIVVAHDLLPSDTATLDRDKVLGIITEVGGATSHTAIIARSYNIPAVLGISEATDILEEEPYVILDALAGKVFIEPDPDTVMEYRKKLAEYEKEERETREYLTKIPLTASGEKFNVGLNIGSTEPDDGFKFSDFVGLFRTEFLYMESDHMPTEEEQVTAYRKVLANAMGNPVTLRTLDIGGDKSLRYMQLPHEDNPFLGNRALRLCLSLPDLFRTQLRAALRASAYGELWIMFPMVGTIDDVRKAKAKVEEVKKELVAENIPFDENVKVGIMIEIPSIAMISDMVAKEVDFASVGTNDLTQYTHAVDRMNANIIDYYQSMSPAMFRLLAKIFSEFNQAGKPISVCGELAGDPVAAIALVGLGLKKLSMNASNIARVKWVLSKFTMDEMKAIGEKVQQLPTQAEILTYLKDEVKTHI
jgi:phosphotransferase system enzyme I (PtsI)